MAEVIVNKEVEETPHGRNASLELYKAANPEAEEPDDDVLHDFLQSRHSELEGRHNEMTGANARLAELVASDPRLGSVLSMISSENPKSLPFALGSVFGRDPFELEGVDFDEFESGYQENLRRLSESRSLQEQALKNIEAYEGALTQFGQDNGLSEEQFDEINGGIMNLADNILMGIIPAEIIDLVYKGLNYDADVKAAAEEGVIEGKNVAIEAKVRKKKDAILPDLGNTTGAGANQTTTPRGRGGSFFDGAEEMSA